MSRQLVNRLWRVAAWKDGHIETVPCGLQRWRENDTSLLVELVRHEGQQVRIRIVRTRLSAAP
jgi:hypothetical protein